jgi:prepilin-type N-terminal cleavage/methylation domain-containing protein
MKTTQKGFTLVEIAIVLVIIGLLLGGILKGQEMIVQAKIKNVIADFSGVSAAYHGYMDRYRAIPGDDPGAGRWATGLAGNGNGIIGGAYNVGTCPAGQAQPPAGTAESCLFWHDLRLAGFVAGTGAQQPTNAMIGMIGVQTGDAAATPAQTLTDAGPPATGFSGTIICSANIPDKMAIAVDTQMDDGRSNLGTVRALLQTAPNPAIGTGQAATAAYAETGTNVYTVCRTL